MRLKDKTAIVTGGASGQGEATARLFVQEGAQVVIADVNKNLLDECVSRINTDKKGSGGAIGIQTDISNEEHVSSLMNQVWSQYGKINILVNSAGKLAPPGKTIVELTSAEWQDTLSVNLFGVIHCMKHVYPYMKKQAGGAIVNIGSTAGLRAIPGAGPYSVSKAALMMLTRVGAAEFIKNGIRVNNVLPGHIDTPMMDQVINDMKEKLGVENPREKVETQSNPMGRLGRPEEVAAIVLFLVSEESSFVLGSDIMADGGFLIG